MATLRRIVKYTPAVALGLLVVAWVISVFTFAEFAWSTHDHLETISLREGSLRYDSIDASAVGLGYESSTACTAAKALGSLERYNVVLPPKLGAGYIVRGCAVPLLVIQTLLLPLAIGPFLSYRFRLWHYLAYTALVAIELAYYLRWQE